MQSKYYGQLDLTVIGDFVKRHPELVKKVVFKKDNCREHQLLNISVLADEQPNQWGKIGTIRMDCPKENKKDGDMVFAGDLRPSTPKASNDDWDKPVPPLGKQEEDDGLPF